ncbi:endonuclease/exonuclease/phosphatase family protein [Luteolibacter sp. LG18]|uniref:endonuclease/exonuclease/phosphatase family protein n=1 Tax=Luteolibacter sp. LG18 TaxID=2819286 RepID=UPI002B2E0055|nr:hypothetical protein llg_00550 [Luteolibacter sp. LG18]
MSGLCPLLLSGSLVPAGAATRVHNDGFTANNAALPGHPSYASQVSASGVNWTATPGGHGINGTPHIAVGWSGQGGDSGSGFDTYVNFGGRGGAIQLDGGKAGGSRHGYITFDPADDAGVSIDSFDLDIAHDQPHTVDWFIRDTANNVLAQGVWTRSTSGRDTVSPAFKGAAGQTLVLELFHESGSVTYLGMDNLVFDEIPAHPIVEVGKTAYSPGEPVVVSFAAGSGAATDRVAIYSAGTSPSAGASPLAWRYVNGSTTAGAGLGAGSVTFTGLALAPGAYGAWFLGSNGATVLAGPASFQVDAPAVSLVHPQVPYGGNIEVSFQGGPGLANDWIAIFPAGTTPADSQWYLDYLRTSGTRTGVEDARKGTVVFDRHFGPPGDYEVWFLTNGYHTVAGPVPLKITSAGTAAAPRWLTPTVRTRHAVTGSAYTGRISAYVSDPGDVLSFEKVAGPSWLAVSADGGLGGTPAAADAGLARFTLRARDLLGHTADVVLEIGVFPPGGEHVGQLKIMSYNTLLRWEPINDGFRKGIESIVLADADVVCLQESGGDKARRAAEALGWFYVPPGNGWAQMISRYPVVGTLPGGGGGQGGRLRLADDPLREVVVYNCYLSANYSALVAAAVSGATAESALAEEMRSSRPENVNTLLQIMAPVLADADRTPVFLTGDFNSSSHLDWTAATAARHNGIGHVEWPCSLAVAAAGMKDSFRVKHPDPVAVPGLSWTPLLRDFEVKDRIDFVYYKGAAVSVMASDLFHTAIETTVGKGQPTSVAADNTWPSDHAAVITCFRLEPVDADGDGMSDAWEKRWFHQLAMSGDQPAGPGLDLRWRMMLGGDPNLAIGSSGGLGVRPTAPGRRGISFPVSEFALGHGLALEASRDLGVLDPWEVLWRYDEDPQLQSPGLVASRETTDQWRIVFEPVASPGSAFYRLRRAD